MEEKKQNEEFQSRREFFKKTAKGALPILGISLFGTAILSSCEKETHSGNTSFGCNGCSGSCSGSCSGGCDSGCSGSCSGECSGECMGCTGSCHNTACAGF